MSESGDRSRPFSIEVFCLSSFGVPVYLQIGPIPESTGVPHPEMIRLTTQCQPGLTVGGQFYYLASWQEGMTDFELDKETLEQVGNLLGSLHYRSQGFIPAQPVHPARIQWGAWPGKLTDRYNDLSRFVALAKEGSAAFERLYTKQAPGFLEDAKRALKKLESLSCYREIVNQDRGAYSVCHRDCIPGNIVKRRQGDLVLIDFDNAAYAERIDDVAKLLRYYSGWQIDRAKALLMGYSKWFPLQEVEIQLIRAFLQFPMEYWHLGRFAYERRRFRHRSLMKWVATSGAKKGFLMNLERMES
jgi:CotS family spore coat protein